MDLNTIYGGGYVCSECGLWNRSSAICRHEKIKPNTTMKKDNLEHKKQKSILVTEWLRECLYQHLSHEQQMRFEGLFQQAIEMEKNKYIVKNK